MRYAKFDTLQAYTDKRLEIDLALGFPNDRGTLTYVPEQPKIDKKGKYIMDVTEGLEGYFDKVYDSVEFQEADDETD